MRRVLTATTRTSRYIPTSPQPTTQHIPTRLLFHRLVSVRVCDGPKPAFVSVWFVLCTQELGVVAASDFKDVAEDDLDEIGLKKIEKNRFFKNLIFATD